MKDVITIDSEGRVIKHANLYTCNLVIIACGKEEQPILVGSGLALDMKHNWIMAKKKLNWFQRFALRKAIKWASRPLPTTLER